jgi:hypothetical protein
MIQLIQFFILSLFLRDNIYFGSTAVSLMNIVNIVVYFYIFISYKKTLSKNFKIIISALLLFFVVELFYVILCYRSIDQVKEFYYSSYIFSILILIYWGVKYEYEKFVKATFDTLYFLYLVILVVVLFELYTKLHLPGSKAGLEKGFEIYPTAFFFNPNDFAVVIVLFLPVLYYLSRILKNEKKFIHLAALSLFFVVVSLSRLCLMFLFLFPFFVLYIQNKIKYLVLLTGGIVILFVILTNINLKYYSDRNSLIASNVNKVISIFNAESEKTTATNNSVLHNVRYKVYSPIINNPQEYIIGRGFVASELLYDEKVIPLENPHSYWAEGIFDFGILGFLPILFIIFSFFCLSYLNSGRDELFRCSIVQILYFIFLLCIPSSIMCLPVVWLPIAIMIALSFNFQSSNLLRADKVGKN